MAFVQPAFAAGNAAAGRKVFKKCSVCQSLSPTRKRFGPALESIIGRTAGSIEGYRYSSPYINYLSSYIDARKKGLVRTEEEIVKSLANPKKYLAAYLGAKKAKSRMTARFKKRADRENAVADLKEAAR